MSPSKLSQSPRQATFFSMDHYQWQNPPSTLPEAQDTDRDSWHQRSNVRVAYDNSSTPHLYPPHDIGSGYAHGSIENIPSLPLPTAPTVLGRQHYQPSSTFAPAGPDHRSYATDFGPSHLASPMGQSVVRSMAPAISKPAVRGKRKPAREWKQHKQVMEGFYMRDDNSLEQLIEYMRTNFQFDATPKQYKLQFSSWGWHKHMTREVSRALYDKHNRRVLFDGKKKSEFTFHDQKWTVEAIQKHLGLTEEEKDEKEILNLPTPYGVTVETPRTISSPAARGPARTQSEPSKHQTTTTSANHSLQPITLRWHGHTVQGLDSIRRIAYHLEEDNEIEGAKTRFQELLDASKHLLPVAAKESAGIAYEVACFFARNDEMDKADHVLDNLTMAFVQRWGQEHQETLKHYAVVGKLLAQWDRHQDAVNILKRMTGDFSTYFSNSRRNEPNQTHSPSLDSSTAYIDVNNPVLQDSINVVAHENEEPSQSCTLALLRETVNLDRALELNGEGSMDHVIKRLIQEMEEDARQNATDIIRARDLLITFYLKADLEAESEIALRDAKKSVLSLCKLEFDPKNKLPVDFFSTSIEMTRNLLVFDELSDAEHLFDVLQERFTDEYGHSHTDTISLLIRIGKIYDKRKEWNLARSRFEAAYAGAVHRLGVQSPLALRLEKCLEEEQYSFEIDTDNDTSPMPIVSL